MAKGGAEAIIHAILIIAILSLTFVIISTSVNKYKEQEKELTEERYSLINTLNSYELFRKSLEATWRISTAQAIFRASKGLDLEGGYWYSYNPSSGKSMAIPQSGCNSANPKICLPTMQGVSSVLAAYMQDYTGSIGGRVIPVNLVAMRVDGIKTLIWPSSGSVTSKISHLTSAEFASGKTKIGREEEIETSLDSNFRKMVFAGYLIVQAAAELSDEIANQGKLKYNPVAPAPAPPALPTLGFEEYRKKAGDYIANKLKGAEEFYTSGIPVQGSRILHVKIDPEGKPESPPVPDGKTEVWAFHLTDDANYPLKDPEPVPVTSFRKFQNDDSFLATPKGKKVCNVFSENEESGSSNDYISTWYIYPGGKIAKGSPGNGKLYSGLKDYIAGSTDYHKGDGNKKASYDPDASTEAVGEEPYTKKEFDKCSDEGPCGLLETQKEDGSGACSGSGSNHCFIPKYELLCDSSGYWRVCNEAAQDVRLQAGEKTYRCNNKAWEAVTEAVNMELIVSTGVNYYPSTLGVLPEQGGLVMKYDASSVFNEEPKYYKDTGSGFSKEPFSLSVKAKDYLPVLDCSKYPDGTRFAILPVELPANPDGFNLDMMCYQDTTVPRLNIKTGASAIDTYKEIYTCERWGYGRPTGLNADGPGYIDNDLTSGEEIGTSSNKYQCVNNYYIYGGSIFCKEHAPTSDGDSVNPDPKFARCCINWNYIDVYSVTGDTYNFQSDSTLPRIEASWRGNEKTDFNPGGQDNKCGGNTFCSGDKVVNTGKGEMCDTRNYACTGLAGIYQPFSQQDAEANGCAYYCDPKGHKFQCNPYNSCKDKTVLADDFAEAYYGAGCSERFCGSGKPTYDGHANFADSTDDVTATTCYNPSECITEPICTTAPFPMKRGETKINMATCYEYACPSDLQCPVAASSRFTCYDANECTTDLCNGAGVCSNPYLALGTPCSGGNVCDGSGNCVAPTPAPTPEPTAAPTPTIILY